nr:hypothetical protein [Tanacetum cinerariifolium]
MLIADLIRNWTVDFCPKARRLNLGRFVLLQNAIHLGVKCLQPWASTSSVSVGDVIRVASHSFALVTEKGSGQRAAVKLASAEKGNFILVDDVLALLQTAAVEPLPPKDDKGSHNRTKAGGGTDLKLDLMSSTFTYSRLRDIKNGEDEEVGEEEDGK